MSQGSGVGATVTARRVALADPDEVVDANPIHGAAGAAAAGYRAALVAGIHTYGWACGPIIDVLGERWLADGWADVSYRRPVHPGDELVTTIAPRPSPKRDAGPGRTVAVRTAVGRDGPAV